MYVNRNELKCRYFILLNRAECSSNIYRNCLFSTANTYL